VPTFVREVDIDAPVSVVFGFHERDDALALLSPPFPPVRVVRRTGGIRSGAEVELRVAGIIRWLARHTVYEPDRLFVDEQVSGPFRRWVHRHEFESVGTRTRLTDRVSYELPGGRLVNALAPLAAEAGLRRMFAHRHRVTKQHCEAAARS
jgi:ligand-binding SRPBCC domain-containing protein